MSDSEQAMDALESTVGEGGGATDQVAGGDSEGSTGGADGSDLPEFQPFTWKDGDKEFAFSRRAELTDWLSNRSKQQQEAIRRAQERAKHFEGRMSELSAKEQAMQQAYAKWAKIDAAMSKNPQIAERIQKAFQEAQRGNGSPDLDRILSEKVKPLEEKLSKYEQAEQQRQAEARRQRAISRLRETHGEVDDKQLLAELNRLQEIPEGDQEYALYELLHFAMQGKQRPADVERKFAEQSAKRRPPSVTSTPGRGKQEPDVSKMSRAEARDYAAKIAGLTD